MIATVTPLFLNVVQKVVSKTLTWGRSEASETQARVGSLTPSVAMMTIFCGLEGELPSPAVPTAVTKLSMRLLNGVAAEASVFASAGAGKLLDTLEKLEVTEDNFVKLSSNDHNPTLT